MSDIVSNPAVQTLVLLFIWVPFALGAYFTEYWNRERARQWAEAFRHPLRHIVPGHAAPTAAT